MFPVAAAVTATLYATSAVASLNSPSPSRILTSADGAPRGRITAVAATASGGATMAPRTNAAGHVNSDVSACAATATATIETTTRSTASRTMGHSSCLNSCNVVVNAFQ